MATTTRGKRAQSDAAGPASTYWRQSRSPLASLIFILPLLAVYECGVLALGPRAVRNGADVWLRQLLDLLGFGQYFLLPVLTIALLLGWHYLTRDRWRVSLPVLYGMAAECIVLGVMLLIIGQVQGKILQSISVGPGAASIAGDYPAYTASLGDHFQWVGRLVGFFGAGIYEEVLFRLMLLPAAIAAIGLVTERKSYRIAGAVFATSLAFSAAHYIGAQGDALEWFSFVFRFIAGAFFALLFVYRGFGIAAGTHALYDVLAGLI